MGNRHLHNSELCDNVAAEPSSAVNRLPKVASESAHATPLRHPTARSTSTAAGHLNKSSSDSRLPSSAAMSSSTTSNRNAGAGPSSSSTNRSQRPSLKFNSIHGENVRLTNNQRIASRTDSFCKALAFSDRAIAVDEVICLRFAEVKTSWSGVLRFGITNTDPATFGDNLPRYACPDMTNKEGTWAKAMSDRYCQQGNIMHFFVRENGEMYYGINGTLKGLFLSGIVTRAPMFVVVDIYGNTTSVEFVDESEVPPLRRAHDAHSKPRPVVPPPPTIPLPAIPTDYAPEADCPPPDYAGPGPEADCPMPDYAGPGPDADCPSPVADCPAPAATCPPPAAAVRPWVAVGPTPTRAAPVPSPVAPLAAPEQSPSPRQLPSQQRPETAASLAHQQLTRELEQRLNFAQMQQRSMSTTTPSIASTSATTSSAVSTSTAPNSRRANDFAPLTFNRNPPLTPLEFHTTHGRTVSFNSDRTIATRVHSEYCGGYVFTARPIRRMEKVIIQVLGVETEYSGGIGFGVTNCSPGELTNFDFPDDADELLNRPEFWAVNKEYERQPTISDELTYYINEKGEVVYQKNKEAARILMHVDPSLTYFMFFDIYGRAQCVRCAGTTDARIRPTSPAPPTIPQHRRRQSHQAPNSHGFSRRTASTTAAPNPAPDSHGFSRRTVSTTAAPNPAAFSNSGSIDRAPSGPTPATVLQQFQTFQQPQQQRSSGLTVNLPPPPDVPRRGEAGRSAAPSQQEATLQPIGQSTLVPPPSSSGNRPGPSRHFDHSHGRHGSGPPPRPNRPPPPAPPQRTYSVPTAQTMARAAVAATIAANMPRPASTSAMEPREGAASAGAASTSAAAAASVSPGGGAGGRECSVCMDQVVNCAVYPCGHMCMCFDCGRTTWQRQGVCPICRRDIKDILRLFPQ